MKPELIEALLNNDHIGITIIDKDGNVVFRNQVVERTSGLESKKMLNRHFSATHTTSDLLDVLRTGIPTFGAHLKSASGETDIINRIPLVHNGEIVGAVTIGINEYAVIPARYNLIEEKLEYYEKELRSLRSARYDVQNMIGRSESIESIKRLVKRYAEANGPVLITGPTGTGKELCAHAIHLNSTRRNGPFVKVNCASIPQELFESELFGYEPGAFTDASKKGKLGKFEVANQGTLFLDEISCLPPAMQPKLLRVLQDGEIERVGGNRIVRLDVRVISATNVSLEQLTEEKRFREDLYYRIKIFSLDLPPLAERKEDIPLLCDHFIRMFNEEGNLRIQGIAPGGLEVLQKWNWPGNIRELRNVMETAAYLCESRTIEVKDLPPYIVRGRNGGRASSASNGAGNLRQAKKELEKSLLEEELDRTGWNKARSAKNLGISRPQLYSLIRQFRLKKNRPKAAEQGSGR